MRQRLGLPSLLLLLFATVGFAAKSTLPSVAWIHGFVLAIPVISNATPSVRLPVTNGETVNVMSATNSPTNWVLTGCSPSCSGYFAISGLGVITVTASGVTNIVAGTYTVTMTASNGNGTSLPGTDTITIQPFGSWWQPVIAGEFQWELDHLFNPSSASDMGLNQTAFNGAIAPATNPVVYDFDGTAYSGCTVSPTDVWTCTTPQTATNATLHGMSYLGTSFKTICYIEVGAVDTFSPDYANFTAITPTVIGKALAGYPQEFYINFVNATVVSLIEARIQVCASQNFDAIEPDIDESYGYGQAATGFPLTKAQEESYMQTLAAYAHSLGLAMLGKDMDDTGDSYAADMEPYIDGQLTEQCNQYSTCNLLSSYTANKAVWNVEYSLATSAFCPFDNNQHGWMGTKFGVNLTGLPRTPCQ